MEKRGIIKGYVPVVDAATLGYGLTAFVSVTQTSGYHWEDLERAFQGIDAVEQCWSVTGDDSYLLKLRVADTSALEEALRQIARIPGVARTRTSVVLSTPFERTRTGAGLASPEDSTG